MHIFLIYCSTFWNQSQRRYTVRGVICTNHCFWMLFSYLHRLKSTPIIVTGALFQNRLYINNRYGQSERPLQHRYKRKCFTAFRQCPFEHSLKRQKFGTKFDMGDRYLRFTRRWLRSAGLYHNKRNHGIAWKHNKASCRKIAKGTATTHKKQSRSIYAFVGMQQTKQSCR